ncbi:TetR/AcrR family transcriptional regulator [Chelatococcus reniformis]|uniref:TetR family transcriptional regulator n=1 Tax=Chelatococcus reniformis TaxID=1494448 RepID=A0A916XKE6_9HYPH|nr:TetR/AcrR family transcriptional regulator [Chelatococcus reniformis]GGC80928.1 TetR family transcriptional regulator [Chelatococcus reniformis]
MKVSREQVAENRQRILDAAARLFRERGFDGVTVAEIMKAAELTHGAFYGHFRSKEELIAQTCGHVLGAGSGSEAPPALKDYAAAYLSPRHRDDVGGGCLFVGLGSEAVRASPDVRHTLTDAIRRKVEALSRTAPGKTAEARRRAAIGSWAAMVGAVLLARLADDEALADELLAETRAWLGA